VNIKLLLLAVGAVVLLIFVVRALGRRRILAILASLGLFLMFEFIGYHLGFRGTFFAIVAAVICILIGIAISRRKQKVPNAQPLSTVSDFAVAESAESSPDAGNESSVDPALSNISLAAVNLVEFDSEEFDQVLTKLNLASANLPPDSLFELRCKYLESLNRSPLRTRWQELKIDGHAKN
jgi:hypothetical protein